VTAQVIFLHTGYIQTFENMKELEAIQDRLYFSLVEIKSYYKGCPPWQILVGLERYHNGFRDRWKVIEGGVTSASQERLLS
jgi:hypothetical protein